MFSFSVLLGSQGCQFFSGLTKMLCSSWGWMSLYGASHVLCCHCEGFRMVVFSSAVLCHFKEGISGSFWAGKSLIQCHTYILVPMTYYSHLHVGRKQILKNILWSSTHWSAWNFSSVQQLEGRRSRNIIYTIFKKKKKKKEKCSTHPICAQKMLWVSKEQTIYMMTRINEEYLKVDGLPTFIYLRALFCLLPSQMPCKWVTW